MAKRSRVGTREHITTVIYPAGNNTGTTFCVNSSYSNVLFNVSYILCLYTSVDICSEVSRKHNNITMHFNIPK